MFGAGRFNPQSTEGRRLLTHELAHVVQQGHGAPLVHRWATCSEANVSAKDCPDREAGEAQRARADMVFFSEMKDPESGNTHVQRQPAPKRARPLPDWDPKGPRGKVHPATFEQKLAEDLREEEESKRKQKKWEAESARIEKAEQARQKAHETEWMERRTRCSGSLGILSNEITIRKNKWSNVVIDLSSAYESAFTSFSGLLSEETAQSQLYWNLAFIALSSVAVGGIAVLVTKQGEKWAKTEAQKLFVDAAEDAVQQGVSGLLSVTAPLLANKYEASSIPSPMTFRGELDKLLNDMESDMLEWCVLAAKTRQR